MRIFQGFPAAISEVERDLKELGTLVHRKSWQGKPASDREDVRELQNYQYTVLYPDPDDLTKVNQPWADAEFKERTSPDIINPGEAWKLRKEVWEELLEEFVTYDPEMKDQPQKKFSYTYNERFHTGSALRHLIGLLVHDPTTRRAYLPVYDERDPAMAVAHRVPCSLGYYFLMDGGKLNVTYYMRSCDWTRHFQDDVYLALRLRQHIVDQLNEQEVHHGVRTDPIRSGSFTHNIANLHVFEKDVAHVF